jgi:hypothetical protein
LIPLVLEAAGEPFTGEVRLPDWDAAINEARAEFDATCAAWKPVLKNFSLKST